MVTRTSSSNHESALLAALSATLSEDELQRTLVAALVALDTAGMDRIVASLGTDTGPLVRRIISTKHARGRRSSSRSAASKARIRQDWDRAWAQWDACVDASSDEDGKYVMKDRDRAAPYLDTGAIANDLEQAAARIQPLLSRVLDEELCAPTFRFADVIRETAEAIGGGLPDWMDGTWEPAWFGPVATHCLLEAEWRMCLRARTGAGEYVDALLLLDQSLGKAHLDGKTIEAFVLGLPAPKQREILAGIDQQRDSASWNRAIGTSTSGWSAVARMLAQRWRPDASRGARPAASRSTPAGPNARQPRPHSRHQ